MLSRFCVLALYFFIILFSQSESALNASLDSERESGAASVSHSQKKFDPVSAQNAPRQPLLQDSLKGDFAEPWRVLFYYWHFVAAISLRHPSHALKRALTQTPPSHYLPLPFERIEILRI